MDYKFLKKQSEDGILIITINRPESLNAINAGVMEELGYLFENEVDPEKLKGIIITGEGEKAFAAGADITQFLSLDLEKGKELSQKGHDVYNSIENCPVPVIAAVNGFALGGGNELAMACHIRLASENAKFGQPEVNLGLIPGYGGTQRLVQYVGKGRALEMLLTGDMINAWKAREYGLVNEVCKPEELMDTAINILTKIGQKGPGAVRTIIESVNAFHDKSADGFAREISGFGERLSTEESKEGVSAFLEKREPKFRIKS